MRIARTFALPVALLFFGCSSSETTQAPEQDRGLEGEGTASSAPDTNPYGVPYPTENIGTEARRGTRSGNRIANFKFLGYPDGDTTKGLQRIALANYFDPEVRQYRLIHIQASGSWCTFCRQETEVVTPLAPQLKEKKVVWLMSLAEGPAVGTPSTKADLDKWINAYKSPFTHLWDSGNKNLGIFYDSAALPWNCTIDARTMEILDAGVGAQGKQNAAEVLAYVDDMIALATKLETPQ